MRSRNRNSFYRIVFSALFFFLIGAGDVAAQLSVPGVQQDLLRLPEPDIDDRIDDLRDRVERDPRRLQRAVAAALGELEVLPVEVIDTAVETVAGAQRVFSPAAAPDGALIEKDVLVVLVNSANTTGLRVRGLRLTGRRDLPALGKTLLTLQSRGGFPLAALAADLRRLNSSARVDYNHVFGLAAVDEASQVPATEPSPAAASGNGPRSAGSARPLRIGLIDSAVRADHPALVGIDIVTRDFVAHAAKRPYVHGTAVASIIASAVSAGNAGPAQVYAAAVFFVADGAAPGATTESLVGALAWLAGAEVDVINMSLAGPENVLLHSAVQALVDKQLVVAAVGNNGPRGAPLYPAAYDEVVAVTAVSRKQRVYRYANRGKHVDFAALGVDVEVAAPGLPGRRLDSGTSLAAPRVAVVAAQLSGREGLGREDVLAALRARATDLGRRGHDKVYGHGLIGASAGSVAAD